MIPLCFRRTHHVFYHYTIEPQEYVKKFVYFIFYSFVHKKAAECWLRLFCYERAAGMTCRGGASNVPCESTFVWNNYHYITMGVFVKRNFMKNKNNRLFRKISTFTKACEIMI